MCMTLRPKKRKENSLLVAIVKTPMVLLESKLTMEKMYVVATVLAFKSREKVANAICKLSLLHTAELYVLSGRGSINYVNVCMLLRAALSLVM